MLKIYPARTGLIAMKWKRLKPPTLSSYKDEIFREKEKPPLLLDNAEKWVARFALLSVLVLFARTLLWVIDGLFYSNPAEIRFLSIASFVIGGVMLWQLLDFKQPARRLFIVFCAFTWTFALAGLIKSYHLPVPEYSPLQGAEYLAFLAWIIVSTLFVVYLFQSHVRTLFTEAPANYYQRVLFLVAVGHFFYFEVHSGGGLMNMKLELKTSPRKAIVARFQNQCTLQETSRLPASLKGDPLKDYCRCDSEVLAKYCPSLMVDRKQCLRYLKRNSLTSVPEKVQFLQSQEKCVAKHFPKQKVAIYKKRRKKLEKNLVKKLSFSLSLDIVVPGEKAQRKLLHCMTVSALSRCSDPKLSSTYECLVQSPDSKGMKLMQKRCRKLAMARKGEFEETIEKAQTAMGEKDFKKTLKIAKKIIALKPDRPEGYLIRGEAYFNTDQYKSAVEDFIIVLNVSDFPPSRAKALQLRHLAYKQLGKEDSAKEDIKKICEMGHPIYCPKYQKNLDSDGMSERTEHGVNASLEQVLDETYGLKSDGLEDIHVQLESEKKQEIKIAQAIIKNEEKIEDLKEKKEIKLEKLKKEKQEKIEKKEVVEAENTEKTILASQKKTEKSKKTLASKKKKRKSSDKVNRTWKQLVQVGDIAYKTTDYQKALEKYQAALEYAEKKQSGGELWVRSLIILSDFHRKRGEIASGELYLKKTVSFWSNLSEKTQKEMVDQVGEYAGYYELKSEWKKSEELLRSVWKFIDVSESVAIRDFNSYLTRLFETTGRGAELEMYYVRELEIYERRFGKSSFQCKPSQEQLAAFYKKNGKEKKAESILATPSIGLGRIPPK